jgi:hypothetical protein
MAWYGMLADVPKMLIAAWIGEERREYTYAKDAAFEAFLLDQAQKFWADHIEKRVPPPMTFAAPESVRAVYPRSTKPLVVGDENDLRMLNDYKFLSNEKCEFEAKAEELKRALQARIGDAEGMLLPDGSKATWKSSKDRHDTDWEGLATAKGATAEDVKRFTTTKPGARVFRAYGPKG